MPNLCPHPCHQDYIPGYISSSDLRLRLCNQAIGALVCVVGSLTDELLYKVLVDLNLFVLSTYIIPAPTGHPESVYISIHNELYMSWKE